jgi:hypothetical protein
MVYGRSTGLSPVSVVVSAIFWGWLWGPVGLILSMPLTLCVVVLGRHIKRLEFIDVLLGDRPALTPVESFYQRMLAGDPDEAQGYAEILLKDRALSAYYDDVAVQGLQLAANDAARGVLTGEQLESIKSAIEDLIGELDEYDDVDPPPAAASAANGAAATEAERGVARMNLERAQLAPGWQGDAPVLCVAGRGPLDGAATSMLVQLLGKHGLGARSVLHNAFSRTGATPPDTGGVAMVCITYLDPSVSPTHLRYLLRRIRQAIPDARILIGLVPSEEADITTLRMRAAVAADCYCSSLRQAVMACVDAARQTHPDVVMVSD